MEIISRKGAVGGRGSIEEQLGIVYSIIFVPQHKTAGTVKSRGKEEKKFNEAQTQRKSIMEFFSLFYIFYNTQLFAPLLL
jgi:hypothetical protein